MSAPAPIAEVTGLPSYPNVETMEDIEATKHTAEHVENASIAEKLARQDVDNEYTGGDDTAPRVGWRRMFRSNPSTEFMREVAEANQHPLDPAEVKKVCGGEKIVAISHHSISVQC